LADYSNVRPPLPYRTASINGGGLFCPSPLFYNGPRKQDKKMNKAKVENDEQKETAIFSRVQIQVVLEVLKEERTISEIAASYQLHTNLVTRWKSEFLESGAKAIFSKDKKVDDVEVLKSEFNEKEAQLYQEIRQLTTQLTWLKKKSEGLPLKKRKESTN